MRASVLLRHCAIPLLVGGAIYVCWRSSSLLMFGWFSRIGLADSILTIRAHSSFLGMYVPEFVRYSLPDGAWVYAATFYQAYVWQSGPSKLFWLWSIIPPALAIGGELGQAVRLVPGTFSITDLAVCTAAALLALHFALGHRRALLEKVLSS